MLFRSVMNGANPGAVIAAIFHPPQAIDQTVCNLVLADDTDNAAHEGTLSLECVGNTDAGHSCRKILGIAGDEDPATC